MRVIHLASLTLGLLFVAASLWAGTTTYDLTASEDSNSTAFNPAGPWGFLSGGAVMPFNTIPQPSGSCFSGYPGITKDWSLGNVSGNCIPAFIVASGKGPGSPADFSEGRRSRP